MSDKVKSSLPKDLQKAQESFEQFDQSVKNLNLDSMSVAPHEESELKVSQKELNSKKEIHLKPKRTFPCKAKFNEAFRKDYEFMKELVCFVAENKEVIGETIDLWTKPFPGVPAEEWAIPVNTPVWGPRYLAERLKGCSYHRFSMQNKPYEEGSMGTFYGNMVVDNTVQRLDAHPYTKKKSIFLGAGNF